MTTKPNQEKKLDWRECDHDYYTDRDAVQECIRCGLLRSTIEAEKGGGKMPLPIQQEKKYSDTDVCMWCGDIYAVHLDVPDRDSTMKTPCTGLKSYFILRKQENVNTSSSHVKPEETEAWKSLEKKVQKHLASAITHGWNDAQEDNADVGQLCRLEAQQNLQNAMEDIKAFIAKERTQAAEEERKKISEEMQENIEEYFFVGKHKVSYNVSGFREFYWKNDVDNLLIRLKEERMEK